MYFVPLAPSMTSYSTSWRSYSSSSTCQAVYLFFCGIKAWAFTLTQKTKFSLINCFFLLDPVQMLSQPKHPKSQKSNFHFANLLPVIPRTNASRTALESWPPNHFGRGFQGRMFMAQAADLRSDLQGSEMLKRCEIHCRMWYGIKWCTIYKLYL